MNARQRLEAIADVMCKYLPPDGISCEQAMNEIIGLIDPLPAQEQEPMEWHEIVLNQKQFLDKMELLLAKTTAPPQPEQEPVAWRKREVGGGWQYYGWKETGMTYESVKRINKNGFECEAIPATPPQRTWVGLTVDEIETIWRKVEAGDFHDCVLPFAEKLEARLKDKNT